MRRTETSDHLAYTTADLAISLMVIFVLLMIVFISNQQSQTRPAPESLAARMSQELTRAGFSPASLAINPEEPEVVSLTLAPTIHFGPNQYKLLPEADRVLHAQLPKLAQVLCADPFAGKVERLIMQGYADASSFPLLSPEESRIRNLELSQRRSLEVARRSLDAVSANPHLATCLSSKIEASGRGQNDVLPTAEASRRVALRIRMEKVDKGTTAVGVDGAESRAVSKILGLFGSLRTSAPGSLRFELSEAEVNEYLRYSLAAHPRFGIQRCTVSLGDGNQISAQVELSEEILAGLGPLLAERLLGSRTAQIQVRFEVKDAKLTYSVLSARVGQRELPARLVRDAIRVVGKMQPEGYDTELPVPLPFGLRRLETRNAALLGEK